MHGRDGGARTLDLLDPNQARYHLRHVPFRSARPPDAQLRRPAMTSRAFRAVTALRPKAFGRVQPSTASTGGCSPDCILTGSHPSVLGIRQRAAGSS